ncbi:MAG: flavodoxin family protein [Tissierellia bacterium]|nr:flavodoxin family protein [Tissierellia bacterium]
MKIAVVFDSKSGNTEMLAEAIKGEIAAEKLVYFGKPTEDVEADLYYVGSCTQRGMCTSKVADFLKNLKNKKVAFFGTAGYGGSESYYKTLAKRSLEPLDDSNEFLGWFYCQGKMPMSVRDRYEKMMTAHPEDKKLYVSLENFDEALSHPDEEDIKRVKAWVAELSADGDKE